RVASSVLRSPVTSVAPNGAPVPVAIPVPIAVPDVLDGGYPDCRPEDFRGTARSDSDGDGLGECERGAMELGAHHPMAISVNSTVDAPDAVLGDGVCETATLGQCTLRAAIGEANASVGTDTITLQALA